MHGTGSQRDKERVLMIVRRFILRHRGLVLAAVMLSCLSAACTMGLLAHINRVAAEGFTAHDTPWARGLAWLVAVLVAGLVAQAILAKLGADLVAELRLELSRRFISMEYERLAHDRHAVVTSLVEDVAAIAPLVLVAPMLAYNTLIVVLYAGYLATVSGELLGILAAFLGITAVASILLERFLRHRFDALREANDTMFGFFRYISEGKKEMALNAARSAHVETELLEPAIRRSRRLMIQVHTGLGFNEAWSSAVLYASVLVIVYVGYASLALPVATVTRFVIGALFLGGPVAFIVSAARQVGAGTASLRHLQKIGMELGGDMPRVAAVPAAKSSPWGVMALRGVSYAYPGEHEGRVALGPIDLEFRRGELAFIVGGNGSGKSTLLLVLASLLAPTTGKLLVDGEPVVDDRERHRHRFSGVFGDFFLFPHVLDDAGALLPDARIREMLHALGLGAQVDVTHGELSKLTLSTGQRKRLALLQCYAEDREVFFFDEWAADQDIHFRDYFYRTLLPELKARGKTVIAISHDDRYFHLADRIVKMEAGRVVSDLRQENSAAA
jgi:cyclic peptide transporter